MGKTVFGIVFSAILMLAFMIAPANAQVGKVGFVNSQKIFNNFEEWTRAQEDFETEYRAWDEEARQMQENLEEMITEYEKQKLILSEEKKREREAAIEAKRQALDAYTKEIFGPGGTAERKNELLVKPLLEKINTAIETVATEGNYDFVFNSDGLAYAKKEYDITDRVLEVLTEQ